MDLSRYQAKTAGKTAERKVGIIPGGNLQHKRESAKTVIIQTRHKRKSNENVNEAGSRQNRPCI